MILKLSTIVLAIVSGPTAALACTPYPAQTKFGLTLPGTKAAARGATHAAVIRVIVLETAVFPASARARVEAVRWGPFDKNQVIRVQPQPGSVCGPGRIERGSKGFLVITYLPPNSKPLPFFGFVGSASLPAR